MKRLIVVLIIITILACGEDKTGDDKVILDDCPNCQLEENPDETYIPPEQTPLRDE